MSGSGRPDWMDEEEAEAQGTQGTAKMKVPSNLIPVINAVSEETGVPFHVIAGVIQTQAGWSGAIVPELIVDLATRLRDEVGGEAPATAFGWDLIAKRVFGGDRLSWLTRYENNVYSVISSKDASGKTVKSKGPIAWVESEPTQGRVESFKTPNLGGGVGGFRVAGDDGSMGPKGPRPVDIEDVYNAFGQLMGRDPEDDAEARKYVGTSADTLRARLIASDEGALWRKYGTKIQQARQWATQTYRSYLGRDPSNAEMVTIIDNEWTPDALTSWLRARPYGNSTLGKLVEVKAEAQKYAREWLGRDADAGEIDWIIANTPGSASHVDAYYEQLKTRVESGDPSFAWAADPETWRSVQKQVQSIWTQAGLKGVIDPRLVNKAATDNWTARDIAEHVDGLPAPGFPQGITVGEVARVSKIASSWKENYLPGTPLTKEEMFRFVQMGSDDIRLYYRSLPAELGRKARLDSMSSGPGESEEEPRKDIFVADAKLDPSQVTDLRGGDAWSRFQRDQNLGKSATPPPTAMR